MKNHSQLLRSIILVFALTGWLFLSGGCQPSDVTQSKADNKKELPKLRFHQPKNFDAAVERFAEIQKAVMAEGPLPDQRIFNVVETIHGSGPGAHSHYHLDSQASVHDHEGDNSQSHGHDATETNEKLHEVQIDVFTELVDIVKWMPDIAADTDIDKDDWQTVKTKSADLHKTLMEQLSTAKTPTEKRKSLRDLNATMIEFSTTLSSFADAQNNGSEDELEPTEK